MPKVSRKQKLATRRALVTAAAQLITEEGIEACTVAAVAAQVGVTSGAVYSNFDSIVQLHAEAVEQMTAGFRPVLDDRLTLPEAVTRFAEDYIARMAQPTTPALLRAQAAVTARRVAEGRELLAIPQAVMDTYAERLERCAANGGQVLRVPPATAALLFVGIMMGVGNPLGERPELGGPALVADCILRALVQD